MFTIQAAYSDKFEIKADVEKTRAFFADVKNFIELMPNVESIHTDAKGVMRWTITDEIPFIGSMRQTFPVTLAESTHERVEWSPVAGETQNFLRYSADFFEKDTATTLVQISQKVEIRRSAAKELHPLAGLAGARALSGGMQRRVAAMIKNFMQKSKERLEK